MHKYEYDIKIKCNQSISQIVKIFGAYLTATHTDDYGRYEEFYDESYIVANYYGYNSFNSMKWWQTETIKKDSIYCPFHCFENNTILTINTREKPTDDIIDILVNRAKSFYDDWEEIEEKIYEDDAVQVGVSISSLKKPLEIIGLTIVEHEIITNTKEFVYF